MLPLLSRTSGISPLEGTCLSKSINRLRKSPQNRQPLLSMNRGIPLWTVGRNTSLGVDILRLVSRRGSDCAVQPENVFLISNIYMIETASRRLNQRLGSTYVPCYLAQLFGYIAEYREQ